MEEAPVTSRASDMCGRASRER